MARKRLNKKVALVGSVIFGLLVLAAIVLIPRFFEGPEKFIKDADEAVKAGNEAIDKEVKVKEYERAAHNYHRARSRAKTDSLRIEILFKLVDVYLRTEEWNFVMGCWNEIVRIDPSNLKARFGQLRYFYIMADSGMPRVWTRVASEASEFIEALPADDTKIGPLMEYIAKWDPAQRKGASEEALTESQRAPKSLLGYLYLLRARAALEMAKMRAVTDRDELLTQVIDDLEKVRELEPDNVDAYQYLAEAVITKGKILAERGSFEERDKAKEQAKELLEQAVDKAQTNVKAHLNLLIMKPMLVEMNTEQLQSLKAEYLSLVDRFPSSARAHSALAGFYLFLGHENFDKAMEQIEKAMELDEENVAYAISTADLHYRKFSIYGQKPQFYKAIEIARNALTLPDAQESSGPRSWANKMNRVSLYLFLANCYIEQVLQSQRAGAITESERQEWLTNAEQAVHEIEQLFGSGEEPRVLKWQGMLELAKGNRNVAIRKLYTAYEQLKALKPPEPPWPRDTQFAQLSYALADIFKNTSEVGAVAEFLISALRSGIELTKPEARLDVAEVLLRFDMGTEAVSHIDVFEENIGPNERSRALRIRAYIGAKQFDEAEKELANRPEPDDPNTIKLNLALVQAKIRQVQKAMARKRVEETPDIVSQGLEREEEETAQAEATDELMRIELKGYNELRAELVERLLPIEPNSVGGFSIAAVCNSYIAEGKTSKASDLVNRFLRYSPDNTAALFYNQMLCEPELDKVSKQRRTEIEKNVLSNIADPIDKAINLGVFYQKNNEPNEAIVEFKKALGARLVAEREIESLQKGVADWTEGITDSQRLAATYLFNLALGGKDWKLAEQIAEIARRENIDGCDGKFHAARLAMAKSEYKEALARLDEALRQRPVFSGGFLLRSNINTVLGNENEAIEDAQKAASLNPLDGEIARALAFSLYRRNKKLGPNVSSDQIIETRDALIKAIRLSSGQWLLRLQSLYAEYIREENPDEALALRQRLQKAVPSVENALLLGRMAVRMALREINAEQKEVLFDIAASAFEQALAYDPQNDAVLSSYAGYYRLTGQPDMAEELLKQSKDKKLLWVHYFQSGQFEDARRLLQQLYQSQEKDTGVVKGLLMIAEKNLDEEAVKKYSEEVLLLEDTVENHLIQIQTFLKVGLVKEAQLKLESFREKYPDEPRALLLEASLAAKQGKVEKAMELTNRSLEGNQDNPGAWRLRARISLLMANYDRAIIDLKKSKSLSDQPDTCIVLAKAYLRAGREEDAITELKNTIDDHPQVAMESRMLLEQIYWQSRREDELKRFYEDTLEELPDSVFWRNRAGASAMSLSDFSKAEQLYRQAWQKSKDVGRYASDRPGHSDAKQAFNGYLQALLSSQKWGKVFEVAQGYVDGDFAYLAFIAMAEARLKMGDKQIAIQYCRKAINKVGTDDVVTSGILRKMYSLLGAEEVSKICEEILDANPRSEAANFAMYNLAQINGQYNKAVAYIDKCLQITEPNSPRAVDYIVKRAGLFTAAYDKTSDNDYLKKAIAEYESLLEKMPNNTGILNNLAYMLAENDERLADALEYAKRVYEVNPNNPSFLDTYAYALYKNRRYLKAAEVLQAALQQYEARRIATPAVVYEHLGMIKEELRKAAEAIAAYEQSLEIFSADESASDTARERIKAAIERVSRQVDRE